jgi:hypothetical protein
MPTNLADLIGFQGNFKTLKYKATGDERLRHLLEESDKVDSVVNAPEVRAFLQMLRQNLVAPLSSQQELALKEIVGGNNYVGFIDRPHPDPLKFPNMNRLVIGLQLIVRVFDYNRIQQRNKSLCGPVTLMHDFAKREPLNYVRFVINMAETRRGSLMLFGAEKSKFIEVDEKANFLAFTVKRTDEKISIVEADYIALGSLRYSVTGLPYKSAMAMDATTDKEMMTWMEEMGYSNVEDHMLNRLWAVAAKSQDVKPKFMKHLILAQNKIASHEVILMCATHRLTEHQLHGAANKRFDFDKHWFGKAIYKGLENAAMTWIGGHWMHCRKIDINPATGVLFALDSWGESSEQLPLFMRERLPWSKVTSWYRGYVSGKP